MRGCSEAKVAFGLPTIESRNFVFMGTGASEPALDFEAHSGSRNSTLDKRAGFHLLSFVLFGSSSDHLPKSSNGAAPKFMEWQESLPGTV